MSHFLGHPVRVEADYTCATRCCATLGLEGLDDIRLRFRKARLEPRAFLQSLPRGQSKIIRPQAVSHFSCPAPGSDYHLVWFGRVSSALTGSQE